jgi:hypothetical protein
VGGHRHHCAAVLKALHGAGEAWHAPAWPSQGSKVELTGRLHSVTLEGSSNDPPIAETSARSGAPEGPGSVIAALLSQQLLLEDASMAKALLGYVGGDSRLLDDNQRLRRRIADLEAVVLRLQAENDALAAQLHDGDLLMVPDTMADHAPARA